MNDFYKDAIEVLETLISALNGNNGNKNFRQNNAPNRYRKMDVVRRGNHNIMRRKILPCNR